MAWDLCLDKIRDVHRHLLDSSVIKLFDFLHEPNVIGRYKVDGNTLATETTRAANSRWGEREIN